MAMRARNEISDPAARREASARADGFTLVEVLIAAALLLIIALGVLPLFTQAMVSNTSGNESTQVSNFARTRVEEIRQLPFNSPDLTIDAGTEKVFDEYYSFADETWKDGAAPAGDEASWTRQTTIRQYGVGALEDGILDQDEALPAGSDLGQIHFKEIEVVVQGTRQSGPLGPSKQLTLRALKSN